MVVNIIAAGSSTTLPPYSSLTEISGGSGATAITLPTMAQIAGASGIGHLYTVKDATGLASTANITLTASGGATIDGAASVIINTNYETLTLVPDGTNWSVTSASSIDLSNFMAVASGGSTARPLSTRFSDRLYARDFGVANDGSDQHVALAAFFAYCLAQSKIACFSAGTYATTVTLAVSVPILGDDQATCIIRALPGLSGHLVRIASGTTGFYLRNMTIDGNAANISTLQHCVAFGSNSYSVANVNCAVEAVTIKNAGFCGLYTEGMNGFYARYVSISNTGVNSVAQSSTSGQGTNLDGANIVFEDFTIQNTGGCAIGAGNNTTEAFSVVGFITIRNGYCYNSGTAITEDNITAYSSNNIRVMIDNVRCNTSVNHNIHVGGDGATVTNCRCENPTFNNIYLSCRIPSTATYTNMTGGRASKNTCIGAASGYSGINMLYGIGGAITDNDIRTSGGNGITIDSSTGISVKGNAINTYATYGINVLGGQRVSVVDNYITAGSNSTTAVSGIKTGISGVPLNCADCVMLGNKLYLPGLYGIYSTDTPSGSRITTNRINGATTNDLNLMIGDYAADNQGSKDALGITYGFSSKSVNATAFAYGYQNVSQNAYDLSFGRLNLANGSYSVAWGTEASTKGRYGAVVHSSGYFTQQGDAQSGIVTLRGRTGTGTSILLTADNTGSLSTINSFPVGSDNTIIHIKGKAVAVNADNLATASWDGFLIELKRASGASSTTTSFLSGSGTASYTTGTWSSTPSLALTTDTTNGQLKLTFNAPIHSWIVFEGAFVEATYVSGA